MQLTVEERVFILESYLKTMSYAHCRQCFFEIIRRQAPVKSVIAKMMKKFRETGSLLLKNRNRFDKCIEMNRHNFQHLL
jgi:hypothetical protein